MIAFFVGDKFDFIKSNILAGGQSWEPHIASMIIKYAKPGSTVIDAGAHIGTHSITMSRCVGSEGNVWVFEPQPKIFRELFMNMALNGSKNIHFFLGGLGSKIETIELCEFTDSNEAGTPLNYDLGFQPENWECKGSGHFADIIPLDSLELTNVSLIKIDVEGMEDYVIEGAVKTILANKPVILIEILGGVIPENTSPKNQKLIEERIRKIESLGYDVKRVMHWDYLAMPK